MSPEFVSHQGEVGESVATDRSAPVLLGDQQGCPAEFGAPLPVPRLRIRRVVAEAADLGGGRLFRRNLAVVSRKNSWSELRLSSKDRSR